MTLLAGVVTLDGSSLPADLGGELSAALTRRSGEGTVVHRYPHAILLKLDHGTLGDPATCTHPGAVTLLAGEPLLRVSSGSAPRSRSADTALLHDQLLSDDWSGLRETRGVFSLAHYAPDTGALTLATDKLGIRPLYCWTDGRLVAFASALRILEALAVVPKRMDLRGVTEITAFGWALGRRTPYAGVELLGAGEIRRFEGQRRRIDHYWRWEEISESPADESVLSAQLFDAFNDAIRLRLRGDRAAVAFLSGGLDSRCIVAALREQGAAVHTFNFALPGTQDQDYGARLARAAGTVHHECDVGDPVDTRWSSIMADAIASTGLESAGEVERPQCAWSGDGGSVGLGHVYLRAPVVAQVMAGDIEGAIDAYVASERAYVVNRLLQSRIAGAVESLPHRSVREELEQIQGENALQRFWIFLMLNDQHRHLSRHFEDIDVHRLELQLPFFDSDFLSVIASVPPGLRLYHRFYVRWLEHFPPYVRSIPWQAYPGHVPCPVVDSNAARLAYQWDEGVTAAKRAMRRRAMTREVAGILRSRDFARPLMRRQFLRIANLIHATGLRDYHYVLDAARTYQLYWRMSGGAVELPA
ncbi:MAG TPA: asparagine synthase-related protein [Gemmatimonadaceae bacterium]